MKTGLTIQQMAQELLRQSKAKQDYLVNTGSLSLSVTTDAPQLRVTENGLDKIAPLDIRQTAHRQLGTYLGIPQKYYELMRTDAPELLAYNANYWFSQKNELRTLRTMDGCARAFLSNRYRRIDNLDIASVTLPVIGELPEARFVSTQITDDFMYIKVVNPRLQADVVPGDVVQAGVIISNSETGLGSVTIQPLIYRLVCSNGMVINDAKTRRILFHWLPIPARTMTGGDGGQPGSRMKKCAQLRSLGRRSTPSSRSFSPCRNSKPCGRWSGCAGCMPNRQMSPRNLICTRKRRICISGSA